MKKTGRNPETNSLGDAIGEGDANGQLNPDWVEWLMGWPIGWSDLEPLEELIWLDPAVDPADDIDKIWATPSVCGNYNRKGVSKTSGDGLYTQVKSIDSSSCLIPRITTIKTNRINRLKAIGNGQVPLCAATAFKLLKDNI